jgi:hypothetical protein
LDCRHVYKTCAFHDALQEGKQKEVHWRLRTSLCFRTVLLSIPKMGLC